MQVTMCPELARDGQERAKKPRAKSMSDLLSVDAEEDPISELTREIAERREFLANLERLGQAAPFKVQIEAEIRLRERQIHVAQRQTGVKSPSGPQSTADSSKMSFLDKLGVHDKSKGANKEGAGGRRR